MRNRTISAIYETRDGGKFATGFNSMRSAEEWRKLIDDRNPGWITEWSIDTAPYAYPEVFHVIRNPFQEAVHEALRESQEALQKIAAIHPCAGTYEQGVHQKVLNALEHGRRVTKHITDKEAEFGDGSERNIRLDAR